MKKTLKTHVSVIRRWMMVNLSICCCIQTTCR